MEHVDYSLSVDLEDDRQQRHENVCSDNYDSYDGNFDDNYHKNIARIANAVQCRN